MQLESFASLANLLLLLPTAVSATCYYVDGSEYTDGSFVACNTTSQYSACCAANKGSRSDICMSSGLCYAQDGNYRGFIYMNGCTDSSGLASECPQICPYAGNNWDGGSTVASYNVLQCNIGEYCCREAGSTTNCCDNSTAVVTTDIGTLLMATATASTTATTTTASATTSGTSTSAAQACSTDQRAVVGGAVGGALGAALLGALGTLGALACVRRRKNSGDVSEGYRPAAQYGGQASVASPSSAYTGQAAKPAQHFYMSDHAQVPPQELSARTRHEMQ